MEPPPPPNCGSLPPLPGTSDQVETGRRGRGRITQSGTEAFIADPSAHFAPRNPPGGNRREEERAASGGQRRYNNRSEGNQLMIPQPAVIWALVGDLGTSDKTDVCVCM